MKQPVFSPREIVRIFLPTGVLEDMDIGQGSYGYVAGISTPESFGVYIYHLEMVVIMDPVFLSPTGYRDGWFYLSDEDTEKYLHRPWYEYKQVIVEEDDIRDILSSQEE